MRPTRTLSLALASTAMLLATGCSKSPDQSAQAGSEAPAAAADAAASSGASSAEASSARDTVPDIGGGVAPGVAFTFNYAFTLPAKAIGGVQQDHANACMRLGPSRCRVTGMTYEQPGEDQVSAHTDYLLAPDLAHRFGSDAIAAVEKADGKLDNAVVNGENAGGAIELSQQNSAAIEAEVARIEARLKAKGLTREERAELTRKVEALHEQLQGEAHSRRDKEESIASTPVSFSYASEGLLGSGSGFGKAAGASWDNMQSMLAVLLLALGYALPWLLPVGAGVLVWRYRKAKKLLSETATGAHSPAAPAGPATAV